jgi:AcrR family transcriptional regulator
VANVKVAKPNRRERAAETRRRMLDAATACFTADGYRGTTMAAIADRAGVAVQTLYFTFHSKPELLQQTLKRAVLGEKPPVPPPQTEWYQAMRAESAIRPALQHLIDGVSQILQRTAPLRPVIDAAIAEPGVAEVWATAELGRLGNYRGAVELLASKHPLATGHTVDSATDVIFVLLGSDTFRAFTHGRGWPLSQWKAWVTAVIERDLFTPPAPEQEPGRRGSPAWSPDLGVRTRGSSSAGR